MTPMKSFAKALGVFALILGLSACAANREAQQHRAHSPEAPRSSADGMPMRGGMQAGGMMEGQGMMEDQGMMDMKSMCDMHSRFMAEQSPEERKKMMESYFGNMSPEMMHRNMEVMKEKCS